MGRSKDLFMDERVRLNEADDPDYYTPTEILISYGSNRKNKAAANIKK